MARGEHPQRTPFYGVLLIVAAMLIAVAVTTWSHPPTVVRAVVLVLALLMALIGFAMTFRDLPPPRR